VTKLVEKVVQRRQVVAKRHGCGCRKSLCSKVSQDSRTVIDFLRRESRGTLDWYSPSTRDAGALLPRYLQVLSTFAEPSRAHRLP